MQNPPGEGESFSLTSEDAMADPELLTTAEAAERLGVSAETLRALVRRGVVPEVRVSAKIRRYIWRDVVAAVRRAEGSDDEL